MPTLFISYRAIPSYPPGLSRIDGDKVIVCCTDLTSSSSEEEFLKAVPQIRAKITKDLYLPAIPRAVVYMGKQVQGDIKALVRELLPREGTRIVSCGCDLEEKQNFAMNHQLQLTLCECNGGDHTMAKLIAEARAQARR